VSILRITPEEVSTDNMPALKCAVCARIGYEEYRGAERFLDRLDSDLIDAGYTPTRHWVCSQACRSQLMFETATPEQQEALKRIERAFSEVEEYFAPAKQIIEAWHPIEFPSDILKSGVQFRNLVGFWEDPQWIQENTPAPVAAPEMAIISIVDGAMARMFGGAR